MGKLILFFLTMNFNAIIFDLGGVLIDLDYHRTIRAFQDLGISQFEEVYSQQAQVDLFNAFETGKISPQHFINELLPFLHPGSTPNQVVHAWNEMIGPVRPQKIELLQELQKRYPIFLLSNTNALHVPVVYRELNKVTSKHLDSFFTKVYLSHEVGMRKPDVAIFQFVCDEQGLDPSTTLFIDDSEQHIIGAQKAGLLTYHLRDSEKLYSLFS